MTAPASPIAAPNARAGVGSTPRTKTAKIAPKLVIAALGVVFGDIGTSPLYALKTCFSTAHVAATPANVLGILSLVFWALVIVVCVKYVGVLLKIDHDGEGGILALLALATPDRERGVPRPAGILTFIVVVGAAMLFGDGIITPSISVISAIEGVGEVMKAAQPLVVPLSVAILIALFAIQKRGSAKVGGLFGPVMSVWFAALAVAGVVQILHAPAILAAVNPGYALAFVTRHGGFGFLVFGAVILCITGVEALYADLSHFGRKPIVAGWYAIVFPALLCNYFGQGALLLRDPSALDDPFYKLVPAAFVIPLVVLATLATVIASQALISGAFTLTEQAIALRLWPRLSVSHTSDEREGEVYVAGVNAALAIGCILLTLAFRSSNALAAAYGLAVACTMLTTSLTFYVVVTQARGWSKRVAIPMLAGFLIVDLTFVTSSLPKVVEGAWVPLAIAAVLSGISATWLRGRRVVLETAMSDQMPVTELLELQKDVREQPRGTMVFFTGDATGVPFINRHRWIRERAKTELVVLMTIMPTQSPYVDRSERVRIERISPRLVRVNAKFGYRERLRIGPVLSACRSRDLNLSDPETSYFYGDPRIVPERARGGMWRPQRVLYAFLQRNAKSLPDALEVAADRRLLLGIDVPL